MSDSLALSNVYAAYTASSRTEQNVSELSQLAKTEKMNGPKQGAESSSEQFMDKVVLSEEALEMLRSTSLAADEE